jgi:hypothetical protein
MIAAAAVKHIENQPSFSKRHLLDVHKTPFHRISRLIRTHGKVPKDLRNLTSRDVPKITVDYGSLHPFEHYRHRKAQSRPSQSVDYPFEGTFAPLRINYLVDPLQNLLGTGSQAQDDYINYLLDTVLPEARQVWDKYLSFVPAVGNLQVTNEACWGIYPNVFSQSILQSGLPNADIAVYVSMENVLTVGDGTVLDVCFNVDTLVVATFCAVEQYGRPVIGLINFCPKFNATSFTGPSRSLQQKQNAYPDFSDSWRTSPPAANDTAKFDRQDVLAATIHQLGHVLAMDFDLYRNFYDISTGSADTPQPFVPETLTCSDYSHQIVEAPATNTFLRTIVNNQVYFELVTPRVQAVVQSHFNCSSLTGARLENDPSQEGMLGLTIKLPTFLFVS